MSETKNQNRASLLSQLHLSLLPGSTQKAELYFCAVGECRGCGDGFLQNPEQLGEETLRISRVFSSETGQVVLKILAKNTSSLDTYKCVFCF